MIQTISRGSVSRPGSSMSHRTARVNEFFRITVCLNTSKRSQIENHGEREVRTEFGCDRHCLDACPVALFYERVCTLRIVAMRSVSTVFAAHPSVMRKLDIAALPQYSRMKLWMRNVDSVETRCDPYENRRQLIRSTKLGIKKSLG